MLLQLNKTLFPFCSPTLISKANEIVTFGDNENDLGMLAMTSQSYAMQNAQPIIQMQAAHTTTLIIIMMASCRLLTN